MDHVPSPVGQLFDPNRRYYPFEGPQWILSSEPLGEIPHQTGPNTITLMRFYAHALVLIHSPTSAEIAQFSNAQYVEFALTPGEHTLMLSHRVEGGTWWDASWQATLQQRSGFTPDLPDGQGHLVVVMALVDADTGILRVRKMTSWPPPFVIAVRDAIRRQLRNAATPGLDPVELGKAEALRWTRAYPTSDALVEHAATIVIRGGRKSTIIRSRNPHE